MIWPEKRKAKIVFRSNLYDVISPIPPPQMLRKGLSSIPPKHSEDLQVFVFIFLGGTEDLEFGSHSNVPP